jgi:hypothetical protein
MIPKRVGSLIADKRILGQGPRKARLSAMEGTKRDVPRMHSSTAPHKNEMSAFTSKFGTPAPFNDSYGDTGLVDGEV